MKQTMSTFMNAIEYGVTNGQHMDKNAGLNFMFLCNKIENVTIGFEGR